MTIFSIRYGHCLLYDARPGQTARGNSAIALTLAHLVPRFVELRWSRASCDTEGDERDPDKVAFHEVLTL